MESISTKMQYYWFVVLYFWPSVIALQHVYEAVRQALMIQNNFRQWVSHRMWEIVIAVVSVWTINNVVEIKPSYHWTIGSVNCFFECFFISSGIDGLGHTSEMVIREEEAVLENVLYCLYAAALFAFYYPKFSAVIMAFVACWLSVLALEIVVDVCCSIWHRYDKKPMYTVTDRWKLVAVVRSSNHGYGVSQFNDVAMFDIDEDDDIFSILVLEVRRRNQIWRSFVLWRVSLLDGTQKKMHEFQHVTQFGDRTGYLHVEGFQSRDLVIIVHRWPPPQIVFLYDQGSGKTASYKPRDFGIDHFEAILDFACLRRNYNADGSIRGWRVRIIDYWNDKCKCHPPGLGKVRSVLRVSTIDFGKKATLVGRKEIVFGLCMNQIKRKKLFRSSLNLVGVRANPGGGGPIIMVNRLTCEFVRIPNFNALKTIDRPLALYSDMLTPQNPFLMMGEMDRVPAYLTKKGCVDVNARGRIVRVDFEPPSMYRRTLEAMFQATPALRMITNADEFRRTTGIEMKSQF